jgi:UDP-GlcNAc:undecaprenyl-phosphate/decaprenyl-phosphate GlcNAc-1-phosphate transferase
MHVTALLIFLIAFVVSLIAIPSIIKVAKEKSLYDTPIENRKIHTDSIPNLGGVAIFLGFYFSVLMFRILCDSTELSALCAASVLLFFVALKDDLISTAPKIRLFYQFIIALIIVWVGGIFFQNIPFFEADHALSRITNMIASLVFIVAIINAYNFIDGIDGLAGSLAVFGLLVFGFVFFEYGELSYAYLSLALAGSTLGFLLFNIHPAKIFMGDIGSMLLGLHGCHGDQTGQYGAAQAGTHTHSSSGQFIHGHPDHTGHGYAHGHHHPPLPALVTVQC